MATSAPPMQTLDRDLPALLRQHALNHDPVSGLPNRISFRRSIQDMLAEAEVERDRVALVWIDLLNLRREYSISGEEGAQRLIRAVADSLRPAVSAGELVCHFSDRCFLLALRRDEKLGQRLDLILEAVSHRNLRGCEGKPEIAAGIAFFPEHTDNSEELIRLASLAAGSGARTRSRIAVPFHPDMNSALLQERDIERELRIALRENQLSLVYQPQIDLATGHVIGVESLTRWNHPTRGFISPALFIPVAERSDLIDEIFTHSLRRALTDAAAWRTLGITLPSIAVNASAANVRHDDFVAIVKREVAANPPAPTQLEIEVTESLLMDDEDLFVERLSALRAVGVKVSLDDFGTRYTGFNALKGLPLNCMKIDKCFVHGIDASNQAQALCRTIVTMASHLHLSTIAEGIEEIGELQVLKKIGCGGGQGYLFQRPVASEQFLYFLREWPERKKQGKFASVFLDSEANTQTEIDPLS